MTNDKGQRTNDKEQMTKRINFVPHKYENCDILLF